MAGTLDGFLRSPDRESIVLAELSPAIRLPEHPAAQSAVYHDTALAAGATVYLPLNELSGSVTADVVGGDADVYGSPARGLSTIPAGETAYGFDGVDDYIDRNGAFALQGTFEDWSLKVWVWIDPTAPGTSRTIVATAPGGVQIGLNASGQFFVGRVDGTPWAVTDTPIRSASTWYQVIVTHDDTANRLRIYVNGVLSTGPTAPAGAWDNGLGFYVGAWYDFGPVSRWFKGRIDEVALYQGICLSAGQVAAHYAAAFAAVWTLVDVDTYAVPLPNHFGAIGHQEVYRRCTSVRQNATELTVRTSQADVVSNPGSWYWDEAAGKLYVHTTTGAHPDTFDAVFALVTLYVATTGVVLNRVEGDPTTGVYYHPWLTGDVPQLSTEVVDMLSGVTNTMSGQITLTNGHGFFYRAIAADGYITWKNKRVRLLLGGSYNGLVLDRSQYVALATLRVEDVSADEERCTLALAPLARATEQLIPYTPYFESAYPHLGDGVRGAKKGIGYGRAVVAPDLTDTSSHGVWTIADASVQTLFAVNGVNALDKTTGVRTALTLTSDYTVDLTACTLTIVNATYHWEDYDIEVDVTGKPDGSGGYLHTFAQIVKDLLQTFLAVPTSEIDVAAFDAAHAEAPEELSVWLKSPRSIASILSTNEPSLPSLERSVMGTVQQTLAGTWTCWIWTPGYDDPSTLVTVRKEDLAVFRAESKIETLFTTVNVYYHQDHSRDDWPVEQAADPATRYLADSTDPMDLYTYLRSPGSAQILAQRYLLVATKLTTEMEFQERGALLAQHAAGDKVLITFDPAPAAAGAWESEPFELLRIEKRYAPVMITAGRMGNLRGFGRRVGKWTSDSAPDWVDATSADKATSGFWCDDNGFIDPANAVTKDLSIWW